MKNILAISVFGFLIFVVCGFANATQTLDCSTAEYSIRMHVNSMNKIADMQIRTSTAKFYDIELGEINLEQFGWELNGVGESGNFIHLITIESASGFPPLEINVREHNGFVKIRESNYSCQCDWGYEE
jgi:hypothetical protein